MNLLREIPVTCGCIGLLIFGTTTVFGCAGLIFPDYFNTLPWQNATIATISVFLGFMCVDWIFKHVL